MSFGRVPSELDYLKLNIQSKSLDFSLCTRAVRLAVLSDAAPQYFVPMLKALFFRQGVRAEIYEAEYDTIELEISDPDSGLYAFKPEFILIWNSVFALRTRYFSASQDKSRFADEQAQKFSSLWETIKDKTPAVVIQGNFVLPYERLFGNGDLKFGRSFYQAVRDLNQKLIENARSQRHVFVNDQDFVASYHGRGTWLDETLWVLCKAYCSFDQLPLAVQSVVDQVLSLKGAGVKCVVLDLDNTLWGGIIGDDGLEGIALGHFKDGEAYLALQHYLLDLKNRGVLLAVCSKNDPQKALLPFREHPEMVLKEKDITVFIANWVSKAENIKTIREVLNIGYDSMVFLDDSPFERNLVREVLPEVIVPELPEDPALYVKAITELNLFETTAFSETDTARSDLYREEAGRKLMEKSFANPEDYLRSLQMKIELERFDRFHLPRVAQLLQRSNQFNLLTRRFTEIQCEAFMRDEEGYFPFYVKLKDKYGDSGLISVVIIKYTAQEARVEEWVMSCRVLARGVEQYTMNAVFEHARARGIRIVKARYEPTAKNAMVKDFFGRFGFRKAREEALGAIDWELETDAYQEQIHFIETEKREAVECNDPK